MYLEDLHMAIWARYNAYCDAHIVARDHGATDVADLLFCAASEAWALYTEIEDGVPLFHMPAEWEFSNG